MNLRQFFIALALTFASALIFHKSAFSQDESKACQGLIPSEKWQQLAKDLKQSPKTINIFCQLTKENAQLAEKSFQLFQILTAQKKHYELPLKASDITDLNHHLFKISQFHTKSQQFINALESLYKNFPKISVSSNLYKKFAPRIQVQEGFESFAPAIIQYYENPTILSQPNLQALGAMHLAQGIRAQIEDLFLLGVQPFLLESRLRRMSNLQGEIKFQLEQILKNFMTLSSLKSSALNFYTIQNYRVSAAHPSLKIIESFLFNTYSFRNYKKIMENNIEISTNANWFQAQDLFFNFFNIAATGISEATSRTLAKVKLRSSFLANFKSLEKEKIISLLKPLDFFLQRNKQAMAARLIPGYWTHAGIWVGTKQDIIEHNIWDLLPSLEQEAKIKYNYKGKHFQEILTQNQGSYVEAIFENTLLTNSSNLFHADELSIISINNLTYAEKHEYLIRTFMQIGKPYDFSFNVEDDSKVVCSEVLFYAFHDLPWKTIRRLGRRTLEPDAIPQAICENPRLFTVKALVKPNEKSQNLMKDLCKTVQ